MAILTKEADWLRLFQALNAASRRLMAAPNWLETCLVFDSRSNHYARMRLAKKTREPLLFKGNDFIHTDIEPVVV